MSDMTGGGVSDLIRDIVRQEMRDIPNQVEQAKQAKADAEAEKKAAEKKARAEKTAKNTKPVPTHPRFDPELVKRCEEHKKMADNWIGVCTSTGTIMDLAGQIAAGGVGGSRRSEWHEVAHSPKFIHIYYRLSKRLIDDILRGNYVAAGYVTANIQPFLDMKDVVLVLLCMSIWVAALRGVGATEEAEGFANIVAEWSTKFNDQMNNVCAGGVWRGPYPVFTAFANSDPTCEVIDDNEVRTRYERLYQYAADVLTDKIRLRFVN